MLTISPTQSNIYEALRTFLIGVLPNGVDVIQAQDNLVPEPNGNDFVTMNAIRFPRLRTNVDTYADALYTGSISGKTMTVTAVAFGTLAVGKPVFGTGVTVGTVISALGTGSGGVGTYTLSASQTVSSRALASGIETLEEGTQVAIQLDIHGPASSDNAQIIATTLRDEYAVDTFATSGFDVVPLYCEDPVQRPFINAEQLYETRWVVEAQLQANQILAVPMQFAGTVTVTPVDVDAAYPP